MSGSVTLQKACSKKERFQAKGRNERIYMSLCDKRFKLYCLFLHSNIKLFDDFNLYLQKDEPDVYEMQTKCVQLLTDMLVRFVKVSVFKESTCVFNIDYNKPDNQKSDGELMVGSDTRKFLVENELSSDDCKEFYTSVRAYFTEACSYIIKKFPLKDNFLSNAEVTDISKRSSLSFKTLDYFLDRFPGFLTLTGESKDVLEQEFLRYQVDKLPENVFGKERMDEKWLVLQSTYPALAKVMLSILSVSHSNADSERVFSTVRRVQTEFRSSMESPLLESLVTVKNHMLVRKDVCYTMKFSDDFLARAKKATYCSLNEKVTQTSIANEQLEEVSGDVLKMFEETYM